MAANSQDPTSRVSVSRRSSARSVIRSALSSGKWLRKAIWIWPLIAAVVLGGMGLVLRSAVEQSIQNDIASRMETILDTEVSALMLWVKGQEKAATSIAVDPTVISAATKLLQLDATPDVSQLDLLQSSELLMLRNTLTPFCKANDYQGWTIVSPELKVIASARNDNVGIDNPGRDRRYTEQALMGKATISPREKVA